MTMDVTPLTQEELDMGRTAHAERLQAAAEKVGRAEAQLSKFTLDFGWMDAVSALIDAKVELALLERGGG